MSGNSGNSNSCNSSLYCLQHGISLADNSSVVFLHRFVPGPVDLPYVE